MSDGISEGATDLFGLPLLTEKGRGRPAHVWTLRNSNLVNLLFAAKRKPIEIARVLQISKPTFYKHYFNEIAHAGYAPLMMRARQMQRLNDQAEAGSVPAEKALAAMLHAEQLRNASEAFGDKPRAQPKKGLKEERKDAAWGAGKDDEDWGSLLHGESGTPLPN